MTKHDFYDIGLEEMLAARERRAAKRVTYAEKFHCTVISFTMNIPGPRKADREINRSFDEGFQELLRILERVGIHLLSAEAHYLPTGPEGYLAVDGDGKTVKKIAVNLENSHPLGRLFDIDVMGGELKPVSRADIGIPERKCLLCEADAKVCGRSRCHSAWELKKKTDVIMRTYYEQQDA